MAEALRIKRKTIYWCGERVSLFVTSLLQNAEPTRNYQLRKMLGRKCLRYFIFETLVYGRSSSSQSFLYNAVSSNSALFFLFSRVHDEQNLKVLVFVFLTRWVYFTTACYCSSAKILASPILLQSSWRWTWSTK